MVGGVDLHTQGCVGLLDSALPLGRLFAGQSIHCSTCEQQAPVMVPRSTHPARLAKCSILAAHRCAQNNQGPSNTPSAATMS